MDKLYYGFYKHNRTKRIYFVKGVYIHSETLERMVAYEGVKSDKWVRPLAMFMDGRFTLIQCVPTYQQHRIIAMWKNAIFGLGDAFENNDTRHVIGDAIYRVLGHEPEIIRLEDCEIKY